MQGLQIYQPRLFYCIDIDKFVPQNHFLRRIEKILDLSFVRELTHSFYSHNNGRPSIDPELFFRMILIGYIFGIGHDRRLCEEISYNLAYRWYCKLNLEDNVPNHSSLSRIRCSGLISKRDWLAFIVPVWLKLTDSENSLWLTLIDREIIPAQIN